MPGRPVSPFAGHLEPASGIRQQAQQRSGTPMAQHGSGSAGQHRRHPSPMAGQPPVTDGIHALMNGMQALDIHPVLNGRPTEPEFAQLPIRHDAMLASSQRRDLTLRSIMSAYVALICPRWGHSAQRGRRKRAEPDAFASLRRQACEETLEGGAEHRVLEARRGVVELREHQAGDGGDDERGRRSRGRRTRPRAGRPRQAAGAPPPSARPLRAARARRAASSTNS